MALRDLLYRCHSCGELGTGGEKDVVRCEVCGTEVIRGGTAAEFRVLEGGTGEGRRSAGKKSAIRPLWELVRSMREKGGPFPASDRDEEGGEPGASGHVDETPVLLRISTSEEVVRYRKEVIGFMERLGEPREGILRLTPTSIDLGGGTTIDLTDLRALQASSASLQVYTVQGVLFHFEFLEDTAFRWESMIQELLREAYRKAGKGEIVEFQPRIAVR